MRLVVLLSSALLLSVPAWAEKRGLDFIQNTTALQQGSTFFVDVGNINGSLSVGSVTSSSDVVVSSGLYIKSQTSATQAIFSFGTSGVLNLTQNSAGGSLRFMSHANSPQILMGAPTMSGSGFIDTQNGSTLYLNALAANRTVTIGSAGLRTDTPAGDIGTPSLRFKTAYLSGIDASSATFSGAVVFKSTTSDGLQGTVPTSVGETYYCSNCTTAGLCVSTGTLRAQFANAGNRTQGCN